MSPNYLRGGEFLGYLVSILSGDNRTLENSQCNGIDEINSRYCIIEKKRLCNSIWQIPNNTEMSVAVRSINDDGASDILWNTVKPVFKYNYAIPE